MIDQNRDGYIDKEDLLEMMTSLGKDPSNEYLEKMITEAPGPINFTMFLTLFGEKLNGTDPEDVIQNAFACFDVNDSGIVLFEFLNRRNFLHYASVKTHFENVKMYKCLECLETKNWWCTFITHFEYFFQSELTWSQI